MGPVSQINVPSEANPAMYLPTEPARIKTPEEIVRVSYKDLPKKTQLAVLCMARLADPIATTSINSYLYYQLAWFNPNASAAELATQAGILVGAKTAAAVCTGLVWGRLADASFCGRKAVLVIGLACSAISLLGYGYSSTFAAAIFWQMFNGAMSSNIAIVRCVVAELNPEKKFRSRALLLLPLFANAGQLLGPLIGGLLSSNARDATLGSFPFALPNLVIAAYYALTMLVTIFVLEETLPNHDPKLMKGIWRRIRAAVGSSASSEYAYTSVNAEERHDNSPVSSEHRPSEVTPLAKAKTPFLSIWTINVLCTLTAHFIINGHMGTFNTLWVVFLSTPVDRSSTTPTHSSPLAFTGGVGLHPRSVGLAMSLSAALTLVAQLAFYPSLNDRFSTVRIWRSALLIFPVLYLLAPFPSLVASKSSDTSSTSIAVWAAIVGVLLFFSAGRTGVTPATNLLINDCVPTPDARGTVNTAAVVVGNLSRSVFPPAALAVFGWGLDAGVVGLGFWCLAGLAVLSVVASRWVKESDGGKILLKKVGDVEVDRRVN